MIIRKANLDTDALSIHEGAMAFAKFTGLPFFPESGTDFIRAVGRIITLPNVEVFVADDNGVVGGIGISYGPFTWNPEVLIGEELFWWAFEDAPVKTGKKLYDMAMKSIEEKGAVPVMKYLWNSPESVKKLYEKDGFNEVETVVMKWRQYQQH